MDSALSATEQGYGSCRSPADPADSGADAPASSAEVDDAEEDKWIDWRKFLQYSGPGLLMSIAFLDTGNLEADLQQGACTGFSLIWLLFVAHAVGFLLQSLSARLGNTTGKHLAQVVSERLPRQTGLGLYCLMEMAVICVDVQQMLGGAVAFRILFAVPLWSGSIMTSVGSLILLSLSGSEMERIKGLFVILVGTMTACFLINYVADVPPVGALAEGMLPEVDKRTIQSALATLGAVVMPHNLFLHSALVLAGDNSAEVRSSRKVKEANKYCMLDAALSLTLCFLVNTAVVASFSQNFYSTECAFEAADKPLACVDQGLARELGALEIEDMICSIRGERGVCTEIGLHGAGDALSDSIGNNAKYVWAIGLLAASQSSVITGTYAGIFLTDGFININLPMVIRTGFTRLAALVPATLIAYNYAGESSYEDAIGQWMNMLQSILLPFGLLPLLVLTDSSTVMGKSTANSRSLSLLCWMVVLLVLGANAYTVTQVVGDWLNIADIEHSGHTTHILFPCVALSLFYVVALFVLANTLITSDRKAAQLLKERAKKQKALKAES